MDISDLAGIGPSRAKVLKDMGIDTIQDMVRYFPRDYDDRSRIKTISMLTPGTTHTICATISAEGENVVLPSKANQFKPSSTTITKLLLKDETGAIELVWFGQPYLKRNFKKNDTYLFTGRVVEYFAGGTSRLQMESPDYEKLSQDTATLSAGRIVPVYTLPKGISQKMFRKWMKAALDTATEEDNLPVSLRLDLCTRQEAIQNIHFPESDDHFHVARRRLVFEELFFMQLALLRIKGGTQPGIPIQNTDLSPFLAKLPFALTEAQQSVLVEIAQDFQKGQRMNRLIQGDVGSGKTVVAAAAAYMIMSDSAGDTGKKTECVKRYQVAIMAPTEVLARQHFKHFSNYLPDFNTVLLTGSLSAKEKRAAYASIKEGHAQMIVGTHALIQQGVIFNNLALVITDEQHRFGVKQRGALSDKGTYPHTMIMTATPIPRTLGLILYGDMDISIINALPPGRQVIKTYCVNSRYRSRLVAFMAKQVQEKRQVYVICPAIDESDTGMASVTAYAAKLQEALPDIPIACLHGRLKNKEEVMTAFGNNEYSIIVSTTVIEVGVDVPNATLIVIENAERFGLSQLHQLRGRVGRGIHQSYCVLVTDSKAEHTQKRMKAMESTTDGFVLSELDLQLRGPGDFFGVQQHGLPGFIIANLYSDMDILKAAQKAATTVNEATGKLDITEEEYQNMHNVLKEILGEMITM